MLKIETISRYYVAEIIEARVEEILEKIDNEFKKVDRSGMLPAGIVFVGSGAELNGLVDLTKRKLRLPACIGVSRNINVVIDKVKTPEFLTALGLVIWGNHNNAEGGSNNLRKNLEGAFGKARSFFQHIIPK